MSLPTALEPLVANPSDAAVIVDFDGSLAPIVDDPARARALPAALDALGRLAGRLGRVAVVSGRPASFLADAVPIAGIALVGHYGLERVVDGAVVVDPRVVSWIDAIAAAAEDAADALPGVLVERKGAVSFTLHYRTDPGRADDVRTCAEELSRRYGLDAPQRGRMAVELRPPVPVDKGTAVAELVDGFRVAAFAGDDAGDLPAFDALVRLASEGRLEHAIRVGVRSPEAPPEILQADVVIDGPDGLAEMLGELADAISARARVDP